MTLSFPQLFAAATTVDITPPIGVWLDGYAARQAPSNDVHDPLLASLLLVKDDETGIALVTFDLVAVTLKFSQQVRGVLSTALKLPEDHILVAATHTHSGPAGFLGPVPLLNSAEDILLQEYTLRRLAGAGGWANCHLQPCQFSAGRGEVRDIGRNRNDPVDGLCDFEELVLRVDDANGRPLAVVMNYGCHPTVLGPDNLAISADYPGATRAALKKIYPDTVFIFCNGATGDVSTRFTRRGQGFDEVERMGRILAGETLKVMQVVTPLKNETLSAQVKKVSLPFRPLPSEASARQQLADLEAELAQKKAAGLPAGEIRKAVTRVEGAQAQVEMAKAFAGAVAAESQVQLVRIGSLAFLALPGEPFTQIVLDIKNQNPAGLTAVVSYGNDYCGYFPDATSVASGTYEALISPYGASAGERLTQEALELLNL